MTDPLITYLHDHLTGSTFALGLLETWHREHSGGLGKFAQQIHAEIEPDQMELRQLIERLGEPSHPIKETVGWFAEKASRLKFNSVDDAGLEIFEGLEMLTLGILGKHALWEVLRVLAVSDARLSYLDFPRLSARAKAQHAQVEAHRIGLAPSVFARRGQ